MSAARPLAPARRRMRKPEIQEMFVRLRELNPHPTTELEYTTPFELLIAVLLSAQATDVGVNKATRKLYPVANTPRDILDLGEEGLKRYISTIGLFNAKAKNAIATCRILLEHYDGEVPHDRSAGGIARGRPQDRQRGAQHRLRRTHHGGGYAYLPSRQPYRPCAWQGRARGGRPAGQGHPRRIPARRPPLADPARPLCLQGAQARLPGLCDPRPVLLSRQDPAGPRAADIKTEA